MRSSMLRRASDRQHMSLDIGRPVMAKANVKPLDLDWKQALGRAIDQAVGLAGLTKSEAAGKADVDLGEFSRWLSGERRPHLDKLFAVVELRVPLVVALARLLPEAFDVRTTIETRRSA